MKHPQLVFNNRFTTALPADSETKNTRRQVMGACYSRVLPTKVQQPLRVAWTPALAYELGFSESDVQTGWWAEVFAGNRLLEGMDPFAMCYGGHQFGQWAGQLGDGRAINLGEIVGQSGQHWMVQLKGAGPTPYSRTADGLAVLRSSVREFLCSEAMDALGVPTTRALSLVLTGERVVRDMFYDGNPQAEPGAVVCRLAPTFLRFGNYEIFASRGDVDNLKRLVDFTVQTEFPELGKPNREVYGAWFAEVCRRTAIMIVEWMRVGFVHGVMNTDNMSILGLTIDYGPYGWLESYDPQWTPNTTDAMGRRYCFGQQPQVALWNLVQLANTLWPVIEDKPMLEKGLAVYSQTYRHGYQQMMAGKLGLAEFRPDLDEGLLAQLEETLQLAEIDYLWFFRLLADLQLGWSTSDARIANRQHDSPAGEPTEDSSIGLPAVLLPAFYQPRELTTTVISKIRQWLTRYRERLATESDTAQRRKARMNLVNPKYVLRNYLAQQAIEAAEQGDFSQIQRLQQVLQRPYDEQPGQESLAEKRPEWARHRAGCSMLSCSS